MSHLVISYVRLWDGTTGAVIKPASTAPQATDPAVVFALSPNSLASDNSTNGAKLPVLGARANAAAQTWTEGNQVPFSVDLAGNARTVVASWFGSTAPTVGQKSMANSIPVVFASDQDPLTVQKTTAGNCALTSVDASATSVTVLAANSNRLGAVITNASTATLYLKFGGTASATSFTFKLGPEGVLIIDATLLYTGLLDGAWSAATGKAYVSELTA